MRRVVTLIQISTLLLPALAWSQADHGVKTFAASSCVIRDALYGNGDLLGSSTVPQVGDRTTLSSASERPFRARVAFSRDGVSDQDQPYMDLGSMKWNRVSPGHYVSTVSYKFKAKVGLPPRTEVSTLDIQRDTGERFQVTFSRKTYGTSAIPSSIGTAVDGQLVESFDPAYQGETRLEMSCEESTMTLATNRGRTDAAAKPTLE